MATDVIHVIRNELRWRDAPAEYGLNEARYDLVMRWSRPGVPSRISGGPASNTTEPYR